MTAAPRWPWLFGLALLAAASCKSDGEPQDDGFCVDNGDCEGLAVCTEQNACRTVECLDSTMCALGNHCDPEIFACFTGCAEDTDCRSGQVCDTATSTCITAPCADTTVDCYYGETCDTSTGECGLANGHCSSCSSLGYYTCTDDLGGYCAYSGSSSYCLLPCDPNADVEGPRSFVCIEVRTDEWYWYGDCDIAVNGP